MTRVSIPHLSHWFVMKAVSILINMRLRFLFGLLIVIFIGLTIIVVIVNARPWVTGEPLSIQQGQAGAAAKPSPTRVDSALITITPRGFDLKAFSHPQGKLFILVENRSGLPSVSLRLDRVGGSRIHEVAVTRERQDWAELFDLTPGDYVLTEANHAEWTCRIKITPK